MKTYNISVDFETNGYDNIGNIFKVIYIILRESKAKITITRFKK